MKTGIYEKRYYGLGFLVQMPVLRIFTFGSLFLDQWDWGHRQYFLVLTPRFPDRFGTPCATRSPRVPAVTNDQPLRAYICAYSATINQRSFISWWSTKHTTIKNEASKPTTPINDMLKILFGTSPKFLYKDFIQNINTLDISHRKWPKFEQILVLSFL